jgi:hypothetical protein
MPLGREVKMGDMMVRRTSCPSPRLIIGSGARFTGETPMPRLLASLSVTSVIVSGIEMV